MTRSTMVGIKLQPLPDIENDKAKDVEGDSDIEDSNNKDKDRNKEVVSTKESSN